MVAPHAGAWIEIALSSANVVRNAPSRPTRARGLKYHELSVAQGKSWSRPTRARGLKCFG